MPKSEYELNKYGGMFFYHWCYGMAFSKFISKNEVVIIAQAKNENYCLVIRDIDSNEQEQLWFDDEA